MSLRVRLLAGFAVIAVVLAGVLVAITRSTHDDLLAQIDGQLERAVGPGRGAVPNLDFAPSLPPPSTSTSTSTNDGSEASRQLSSLYIGRVVGDEVETLVTPGLGSPDAALPLIDTISATRSAETGEAFVAPTTDSGLRYRARADTNPVTGEMVVIALPMDSVDEAVHGLVTVELVGAAVILLVLTLVAWWVIRLGIHPVREMTDVASAIAAGDLSHRVLDGNPHTEAGALGAALNRMLGSIEEAFEEKGEAEGRLRRFVADASHELKTPVSTIRGYAELYSAGALECRSELDDAMRRTQQETVRMGGLIDDLLDLANLDEGRPLDLSLVDLSAVAVDAGRDAAAVQPDRPVSVVADRPVTVQAEEDKIRQIVANLVSNALTHTPETSELQLRVDARDECAVIEVSDRGPGMTEENSKRAFERFYRADPSRSRRSGGSGLGLAIVDSVVSSHGGRVSLRSAPEDGTTITIELPLADNSRP